MVNQLAALWTREAHREMVAIRRLDRHLVPDRAARLDDRGDAGLGRELDPVREGEVGVARQHGRPGALAGAFNVVFEADLTHLVAHRPSVLYWMLQPGADMNGVGLGVLAATRVGTWTDSLVTVAALGFYATPLFWVGLMAILLFSVKLDWLPMVYRADLTSTGWQYLWEQLRQSIMPVVVLGLFQGASLVRYVRSAVLDVVRLDYVTTARSKGIGERAVTMRMPVDLAAFSVASG